MKLIIKYLKPLFKNTVSFLFHSLKLIFIYRYWIISLGLFFGLIINYIVISYSSDKIFSSIEDLPAKRIGIVFGAKVLKNGQPSDVLGDRLITAYRAYNKGKISKIIVTGDNSTVKYNEPYNMKKYLIKLGVKDEDIYCDYAGFDTFDSLYRAKNIFGVTDVILFTQNYHLSRAVYVANALGINAVGMSTDLHEYASMRYYLCREFFSRTKGFLDSEVWFAKSKYLGPKIEIK